mgnify:CR=1 FL=1
MHNPICDFGLDPADLHYVGHGLQRPECILAERDGTLWAADATSARPATLTPTTKAKVDRFIRMSRVAWTLFAIATGSYIGQLYDGTVIPLAGGFTVLGVIAFFLTEWAERRRT